MSTGLTWFPLQTDILVMTNDVPNPDHDRRVRHGYRGKPVIEKGTVIQLEKQECEVEGHPETRKLITNCIAIGFDRINAQIYNKKDELVENQFVLDLLKNSAPLNDVKALFLKHHVSYVIAASEFAALAVEKKMLTMSQVEEIIKDWKEQD